MNVTGIRVPRLPDVGKRGVGAEGGWRTAEGREMLATERHQRSGKVRTGWPDISVADYIRWFGGHLDAWWFSGIEKGRGQEFNRLKIT